MRIRARIALSTALLLLFAAGCSRESEHESAAPVPANCTSAAHVPAEARSGRRLARLDVDQRPQLAAIVRMRELGGDPRPVLPGVRALEAVSRVGLDLPGDANRPYRERVSLASARFRFTKRVLVAPRVRVEEWRPLAPVVMEIERDEEGRHVDLEIDLSELADTHARAALSVTVFAIDERPRSRYDSPVFRLPAESSWLAWSVGILEPAWSQGAVRFRLQACDRGDCTCLHEEVIDPSIESRRGWQERLLALDGLAGEQVSLRFESEAVEPAPGGYRLAQWEVPRLLVERAGAPAGRSNLLLISLDTLRADHLGAYGYPRDTSPYISGALAAQSTLFEDVSASATTTAPSHMTLFTSLPPSVHGVASNLRELGLPDRIPTLASVLRDAGYVTGSVNENAAISRKLGFDRGFDYYVERTSASVIRPAGRIAEIFEIGRRFMERHRHERFFLFLHTYEVHYPYTPPGAQTSLFPEGDDPEHPDNRRVGPKRSDYFPVLYDREIRHADQQLERLLTELAAAGLLDDTLVVITSDHGEAFFEHDFLGHGSEVYQETLRVPLMLLGPGIEPDRRIDAPVGLVDLMPSLLDWLGVPAPGGLTGRSFAGLLRGEEDQASWRRRPIISEAWHPTAIGRRGPVGIDPPVLAVRRGDLKLVRAMTPRGPRYELYDLASDPKEQRDRFDAEDPTSIELRKIADAYESDSAALAARLGLPPLRADAPDSSEIDPERLEALRALGYVE